MGLGRSLSRRVRRRRGTMGRNATTIPVDPLAPDEDAIQRAVAILEDGGIVAYPTETFYGLAVDASSVAACARLFEVKGRPKEKALPCVIASAGELAALARRITPDARVLSERFWPGPLTLVVDARIGSGGCLPGWIGRGAGERSGPRSPPLPRLR